MKIMYEALIIIGMILASYHQHRVLNAISDNFPALLRFIVEMTKILKKK